MTFVAFDALWLLAVVPVVAVVSLLEFRRGRALFRGNDSEWATGDSRTVYVVKWFFSTVAFLLALVSAVVALAGPQWGMHPREDLRAGRDIVVALDVSRSMLATDIAPNRLSRAVDAVQAIVHELSPARFALVVFKGDATLLVPLTENKTVFSQIIPYVGPGLLSTAGTNLERALAVALRSFAAGGGRFQTVLLITDAEELGGDVQSVLADYRRTDTVVHVAVVGTETGSQIPLADGNIVTDRLGNPVVSRVDRDGAATIADLTGGVTVDLAASRGFSDLVAALATPTQAPAGAGAVREAPAYRLEPVDRSGIFVTIALFFVVVVFLIRVVKWKGLF